MGTRNYVKAVRQRPGKDAGRTRCDVVELRFFDQDSAVVSEVLERSDGATVSVWNRAALPIAMQSKVREVGRYCCSYCGQEAACECDRRVSDRDKTG